MDMLLIRMDMTVKKNLLRVMPWGDLPRPTRSTDAASVADVTGCAAGSADAACSDAARADYSALSGVLLVDKPADVTSHDVVGAVRRLAGTRKVGHAGTLDPMATGLLTLGIGAGTRLLTYMSGHDKTYQTTIRFGAATRTDDAQGEVIVESLGVRPDFSVEQLDAAMARFVGPIMQRPASVSAIKIAGERAYARVRAGEEVVLPERPVTVYRFARRSDPRAAAIYQLGRPMAPAIDVDVEVRCSAGTYVRALARDLGEALGMGAHLTALRRTHVGAFSIDEAHSIPNMAERVRAREPLPIIPLAQAAVRIMEPIAVTAEQAAALRHGQFINLGVQKERYPVALLTHGSPAQLVAIGKARGQLTAPATVFPA